MFKLQGDYNMAKIIEQGYRPTNKLDTSKPPKGGSAVPSKCIYNLVPRDNELRDAILADPQARAIYQATRKEIISKMNNWISVKDKMPEHEVNVIFWDNNKKECHFGSFDYCDNRWWAAGNFPWFNNDEITHWMELPKGPINENT